MMAGSGRRRPAGRIAYVDGRYVRHADACVHVEDRGLQFSDSVYEVCAISDGGLLDEAGHLNRLERSLTAVGMAMPMSRAALSRVMRETVRRNRVRDGLLYMQVTRGTFAREHAAPAFDHPTLIMTVRRIAPDAVERRRTAGVGVITRPDIRWARRDIKATGLLPNVLAKTEARAAGAFEAWFVDREGMITEGASTNAWIVTGDTVVTRALSSDILAGVTRAAVLRAADAAGMRVEERAFSRAEALGAREAFLTSATGGVMPVVVIDGAAVGSGRPGPFALRLQAAYAAHAERTK